MLLREYSRPVDLQTAYKELLEHKDNSIIGGGAWLKLTNKEIPKGIDLTSIGLNEIINKDDYLEIGSMTSLRQIETSEFIMKNHDGILSEAVKTIMGMNIRNIATIGGSIMGKYAFSDIFTPVLVMETSLVFFNSGVVTLEEFVENKKFPKDILTHIRIKKQKGKSYFKSIKKTALDFPVLNIAIINTDSIKIAVGARPGIAKRLLETESIINETKDVEKAIAKALQELSLSSNSRAGKEYREELLKVYLKRGLKEVL